MSHLPYPSDRPPRRRPSPPPRFRSDMPFGGHAHAYDYDYDYFYPPTDPYALPLGGLHRARSHGHGLAPQIHIHNRNSASVSPERRASPYAHVPVFYPDDYHLPDDPAMWPRRPSSRSDFRDFEQQKEFYRLELEREAAERKAAEAAAVAKFKADEQARKDREKREEEEWKLKQIAKAKEEKDKKDKADAEYRERATKEMLAAGYRQHEIDAVLDPKKRHGSSSSMAVAVVEPHMHHLHRPIYPRVRRAHVSEETLRYYRYQWEVDRSDRDYLIILHELSEDQTEELFRHTRRLQKRGGGWGGGLLGPPIEVMPFGRRGEPVLVRRRSRSRGKSPLR